MSKIQTETSHNSHAVIFRHNFTEITPMDTWMQSSVQKTPINDNTSSRLVIGGDRRHFVKTVLATGEGDPSRALGHIFQNVVSRAVASGGTPEIIDLYQKDLFYYRKTAAIAIAPSGGAERNDAMRIIETDDGEVLVGKSRIPGSLETPDLVLAVLPRPHNTSESTRLVLLQSDTPGVSFRSVGTRTGGIPGSQMIIADTVALSPSRMLGRVSGGSDFSDRILFGWGAFGSAAMLALLGAQAIRLVSWSYRESPGDWISSHESGYTFGDVILDQEASRAYLIRTAESADEFSESAHIYGYKALRYAYRSTSRIVERAATLLETANPLLSRYLDDKRMECDDLVGWLAEAVPSFIRGSLPLPADRLLDSGKHAPAA